MIPTGADERWDKTEAAFADCPQSLETITLEHFKTKNPTEDRVPVLSDGFKTRPKDAWQHYTPVFNYTFIDDPRNSHFIETRVWSAGGLVFGAQSVCASVFDHTEQHVQETGHLVCVHRVTEGSASGLQDESPYSTPPYSIAFRAHSQTYSGVQTPGYAEGVYVLANTIEFDPSDHEGMLLYSPISTLGRLLNAEFDFFFHQLHAGATSLNRARVERLIGCFSFAVNGARSSADIRAQARAALGDLIRDFIEQHLHSPRLTTDAILNAFGVSRASLYRIFEADGGVRNYISTRRLVRAVFDLSTKPTVRGEISQIAEKWGFSSSGNFHRSVKTEFGVKPGSLFEHPLGYYFSGARKTSLSTFFDDATGWGEFRAI